MMPDNNPYLEGYIAAISGNRNCPYDEGTVEWERWWKGFGAITG